ncbi:MAG: hypothetical protein MHPSP_000741, partial [Paramarteilia canceri]
MNDEHPYICRSLSGILARILAVSACSPLELFKTIKMSQKTHYSVINSKLKYQINQHGRRIYFNGLMPTIYRDVPFSAIYWPLFEYTRLNIERMFPNKEAYSEFRNTFIAGSFSGIICTILTQPFDAIKTKKQA